MKTAIAVKTHAEIARPLPVLVPLIQNELAAGNHAGLEHYRRAGEMLLEARTQVATFKWGKWLTKNFELGKTTAFYYMTLAERARRDPSFAAGESLRSIIRPNAKPNRSAWKPVFAAASKIDVDTFTEARQTRTDETQLHRDLAMELIDIGFKALAIKLHPDRGGPRDGMRRLNRVREELTRVAETRRFE